MLRPEFAFENTGYYVRFRIIAKYIPIFHAVSGSYLGGGRWDFLKLRGCVSLRPKI